MIAFFQHKILFSSFILFVPKSQPGMFGEEECGPQGDEPAAGDDEEEAKPAQPLLDGLGKEHELQRGFRDTTRKSS